MLWRLRLSWLKINGCPCSMLRCIRINFYTLQHTATHCNTLQHTATHCNALRHTETHVCRHFCTRGSPVSIARCTRRNESCPSSFKRTNSATHYTAYCITLQHIHTYTGFIHNATHCYLQASVRYDSCAATHCNTHMTHVLQHTATHTWLMCCNTLQHSYLTDACKYCNTLQHTPHSCVRALWIVYMCDWFMCVSRDL